MVYKSFTLAVLVLVSLSTNCYGQKIEHVAATFQDGKVTIAYDLVGADPSAKYNVSLYSSHDNYASPLNFVTGAVGENVGPGKSRSVIWDAKAALPTDFDKEIVIKVKAVIILPPIAKINLEPLTRTAIKRGTTYDLGWVGGAPGDNLTIELIKDNKVQQTITQELKNTQRYGVLLPKNIKPGKNYSLRVTNTSRSNDQSDTSPFEIKPRIPLLVKVLPIAVVAGVVLSGSKSSKDSGPAALTDLPDLTFKPN